MVVTRKVVHANLLKITLHQEYFQRIWLEVQNSDIEKYIPMVASEGTYFLRFFGWLLLKGSCENKLIWKVLMVTHILHFLINTILKRNKFLWILSKQFELRFHRKLWGYRISFKFCSKTVFWLKEHIFLSF